VEVRYRQKLSFASLEPLFCRRGLAFRAVPVTTTVVRDGDVCTILTARDMPTESRGAAALDRAHHLQLAEAQVADVGATPGGSVVAEDVRDLESGTSHGYRRFRAVSDSD